MKRIIAILFVCFSVQVFFAQQPFGRGKITVQQVAHNAVRIQYDHGATKNDLPDWLYVRHDEVKNADIKVEADYYRDNVFPAMQEMRAVADELETITAKDYWPFPTYTDLLYSVN